MPRLTVVVPAYNAAATLPETLDALHSQTLRDIEILIVDDGANDATSQIARAACNDPRIRHVRQPNRGLAGARNTGIAHARAPYIGFCDADDLWHPEKAARHTEHLDADPTIGISYSGSSLIDCNGAPTGHAQRPALNAIDAKQVFLRNPIGNGSAPVMRRAAIEAIAYMPPSGDSRAWVFDETFRQSEDIECWLRLALTTEWKIAGVPGLLTSYRVNPSGLSADLARQLASWEAMVAKLAQVAPEFFAQHTSSARAYQLRYLARRAVSALDAESALPLIRQSLQASSHPLVHEPAKTLTTALAAALLRVGGAHWLRAVSPLFHSQARVALQGDFDA